MHAVLDPDMRGAPSCASTCPTRTSAASFCGQAARARNLPVDGTLGAIESSPGTEAPPARREPLARRGFGRPAAPADPRHWIRESGNGCHFTASDSGDWQRFLIHGIGFGRLATVATPRHWIRESGNRCPFLASVAANRQALPVSKNRCRSLETVAAREKRLPLCSVRRPKPATAAANWRSPPVSRNRRRSLAAHRRPPKTATRPSRPPPAGGDRRPACFESAQRRVAVPSGPVAET